MDPPTLHDLLSNHIILSHLSPLLSLSTTLHLSATSRPIRALLLSSPATLSRLDLQPLSTTALASTSAGPLDIGGLSFRSQRMDEALTEAEFYSGPLRGVFSRLSPFLANVGTLVLDGLTLPAEAVIEVINDERLSALRMLSLRGMKNFNGAKFGQALRYACRPSREGRTRLRGVYVLGPLEGKARVQREAGMGVLAQEGAQIGGESIEDESGGEGWYGKTGEVIVPPFGDWAETVEVCKGVIALDAVLCRGPKHDVETAGESWVGPCIASYSLKGCEECGSSPERPAVFGGHDEATLPLLAPPPLHSTTVRAAQQPDGVVQADGTVRYPPLILRCGECIRNRHCRRCNKWWCEKCYEIPTARQPSQAAQNARSGDGTYWGREAQTKVYLDVCTGSCLRSEVLAVADGMWA